MNCKQCGAEIDKESKYCKYCNVVINENGKDYSFNGTGECFVVDSVFTVSNRSLIIGIALQQLKVGDVLWFGKKQYTVNNMQVGSRIVNMADTGVNCGLILNNFSKKDLKRGDKLIFKCD